VTAEPRRRRAGANPAAPGLFLSATGRGTAWDLPRHSLVRAVRRGPLDEGYPVTATAWRFESSARPCHGCFAPARHPGESGDPCWTALDDRITHQPGSRLSPG
jgi:hypothetical protein